MGKILCVVILLFIGFGTTQAQVSSAAFYPNCYQPVIGTPGVVDTIYGAYKGEELGSFVKTLWPDSGSSYGSVIIDSGFSDSAPFLSKPLYESGPNFNLHKLQSKNTFNLGYLINPGFLVKRGHYHSRKYTDLLFGLDGAPARIYWADEQGTYDSTRYTELITKLPTKYFPEYNQINTYSTYLTSDTVEDIVYGVILHDSLPVYDSMYLLHFKGGESLYKQGKTAVQDSSIYFGINLGRDFRQGDFRGVGREDLIACTKDNTGSVLFYKNDFPFSLSRLASAIKYDTLMNPIPGGNLGVYLFSMQAFRRLPGDSSIDFMVRLGNIYIFRGGPNFGSHRLSIDKTDFTIHSPEYYDNQQWYHVSIGALHNCGDMTGTGNNVLHSIGAPSGTQLTEYEFFYVLGDAIDDKVDMFLQDVDKVVGLGGIDTLVADHDNLQDIIIGMPEYGIDDNFAFNGTVRVIHGSKKIPVHINSVSSRKSVDESPYHILAHPNPCDEHTVLTFDNCAASKMQIRIISSNGVEVRHEETPAVDGLQQYAVDLSSLAAGEYIINLSCPVPGWSSSINVIKTGAAVTPWSLDLKKMVGR